MPPSPRNLRLLFVLRHRNYCFTDECYSYGIFASGLYTSAQLVVDMLQGLGHEVKLVEVIDSNDIDREVFGFQPDICVIEAYFVPPVKFRDLHRLHPDVKFVVRNHSAMPFLALEGSVIEWSLAYMNYPNVYLACNDERTKREFQMLVALSFPWENVERVILLPNYYPPDLILMPKSPSPFLDVGNFGAIRPLKNQLIQAVAAIEFASSQDKPLRFHINATRLEQNSDPILKNLRALFDAIPNTELVEHPWLERADFLKLCAEMDIGLQVSMSETFSIGSADLITRGVPVVTSSEVPFVDSDFWAAPTDSRNIVTKMWTAMRRPFLSARSNIKKLKRYSEWSKDIWQEFMDRMEE